MNTTNFLGKFQKETPEIILNQGKQCTDCTKNYVKQLSSRSAQI